jgi:hypothetical protein
MPAAPPPMTVTSAFRKQFVVLAFHLVVGGDDAQAGSLADLPHGHGPYGSGLVHGFIVEPSRHHPVQFVDKGQPVPVGGSDNILRLDGHAVFQQGVLGAHVGNAVDVHAGVAALAVQAVEPAGAVVFQAACKDPDAIGKKGRCNRISGNPLNVFPR